MVKQRPAVGTGDSAATKDALEFRAAVRDVKPLRHAPRAQSPPPRAPRRARPTGGAELPESAPLLLDESIGGADPLSYRRPGVRDQQLRRLRRGLYPVDDELDLHDCSQSEARARLGEFIDASVEAGRRCVRIIHGKGYRSGARGPILKIAVNAWLRRHAAVMAFSSARAIDGGTGALYVLLRA